MKISIAKVLILSTVLLLTTAQVYATSFLQTSGTNWEIGVGSYAVVIDDNSKREEFGGGSLLATFIFNHHFSIRGQYYSVENDDRDYLDLSGYEVNAYIGVGLQREGFKAYSGVGFYSETLKNRNLDTDVSGAEIAGGIGYNWRHISVDFAISLRTVGDYADYFDEDDDNVTAAAGVLSVAYRF